MSLFIAIAACLSLAPPAAGAVIEPEPILVGGLPREPLPGEEPPPPDICGGSFAEFLRMNNIPCDTAALSQLVAYLSALSAIPGALNVASLPPDLLSLITTSGGTDPIAPPPSGSIADQILAVIGGIPAPYEPGSPPPATAVPEPGTALLLMAGLAGLATTRRRRRGR